jgi:hypothetical protein
MHVDTLEPPDSSANAGEGKVWREHRMVTS